MVMQVARVSQAIYQRIAHRIFIQTAGVFTAIWPRQVLIVMVVAAVLLSAGRDNPLLAQVAQDVPAATESAPLIPEALQRLVAPIALYPDALVAQILAASTYPSEIVEADRWLQNQSNPNDEKTLKITKRNNQTTTFSRLLLPHTYQAGKTCARWRQELFGK
jgi:hypothetical protein